MKVFDFQINRDVLDRLDDVDRKVFLFNLLRRLAIYFGGRCVYDAICHYLALNGYDVHKL